jgi:hypothetical protein
MARTSKGRYTVHEDDIPGLRNELNFILQYVGDRLDALEIEAAPAELTTETGLVFGEIYFSENTTAVTLNSAAKVQIAFEDNGIFNGMIPNATEDHIEIESDGEYFIAASIAVANQAAQAHKMSISMYLNNGATECVNVHADRTLAGGSTDVGSMSLNGLVELLTGDTVELWAITDSSSDRDVLFEDVTISIIKVGI